MQLPVDEWRPRMQTREVTSVITGAMRGHPIEAFGHSVDELWESTSIGGVTSMFLFDRPDETVRVLQAWRDAAEDAAALEIADLDGLRAA